jgi:hypothetical protein
MAGSHQFNAISRSSLWLVADPEDEARRVLVRGKGNHSAAPRSFEFEIVGRTFELNGHGFEMPIVVEPVEGDRTVRELLAAGPPAAAVRHTLAERLAEALTHEVQTLADLARAVDRKPTNGTVRRALDALRDEGRAIKAPDGWRLPPGRAAGLPHATPTGSGMAAPKGNLPPESPESDSARLPGLGDPDAERAEELLARHRNLDDAAEEPGR